MNEIGVEVQADFLKGDKGEKGDPTATIKINQVLTGEAGTDAIIENVGTDVNMELNITIPRGNVGTPIVYNGTFEDLKNSEVDKGYNYIILDTTDTEYQGHWVYYDRESSEWKKGEVYLAQNLTDEANKKLDGMKNDIQDNISRQDILEQKYDEQNAEMVDARGEYDLLGNRLNAYDSIVKKKIYHFENIETMKNNFVLKEGDVVQTLGYYEENDGGAGLYKIRVKTDTDIEDGGSIHFIGNNFVAELIVVNNTINVKQFGAIADGITDNTTVINNVINYLKKGGTMFFPVGEYVTNGKHIIDADGEVTIEGAGENVTNIIFNGSTYCFWVLNNNNHLLIPVTFKNFRIYGSDLTSETEAFRISDRWGCKLYNILSQGFSNGSFTHLYNNIAWTEGTIIEKCMIRQAKNGIICSRNINKSSNTDSFYNTKIINTAMDLNVSHSRFINLAYFQNENFPINAYQWDIKATIWFGNTGGDKRIINVGNYNYIDGNLEIHQDGTADVTDGSDMNLIQVADNGICSFVGKNFYKQNAVRQLDNNLKIYQFLKQSTIWQYHKTNRVPLAYFKGLKFEGGIILSQIDNSNSVLFQDRLLPYSSYKVKLTYHTTNSFIKEYIITSTEVDFTVGIKEISSNDNISVNEIILRPKDGLENNKYSVNNGLIFEIYANELESDGQLHYEIEML